MKISPSFSSNEYDDEPVLHTKAGHERILEQMWKFAVKNVIEKHAYKEVVVDFDALERVGFSLKNRVGRIFPYESAGLHLTANSVYLRVFADDSGDYHDFSFNLNLEQED